MAHAIKAHFGVGKQTGTDLRAAKVARTRFAAFHSLEFDAKPTFSFDPSSRRRSPEYATIEKVDAKFSGVLEGSTTGPLLYLATSALGAAPTSAQQGGSAAYLHTFDAIGDTVPTAARLSLEKRLGTINEALLMNGVVTELGLSGDQEGNVQVPFKGVGSTMERVTPATTPTFPAITTLLGKRMTTITLDSETTLPVRSFKWNIMNHGREDIHDVSSIERRDTEYGEFEATFELEAEVPSMDWIRRTWGGTAKTQQDNLAAYYPVNIKTERPDVIASTFKHRVELDLGKSALVEPGGYRLAAKDIIVQSLKGRAIYDSSTSRELQLKIMSTDTAA